ncbi:hypothetical protein BOX15_Mlig025287g1 [Macrostomum lignano]|uniref:Uncharacterized protein n=1 Tax=Macrostomum lignano TaxID=282301 RepID=A0A267H5J9_9PLAT|nr:hypothetical protein BOX15_Mlig025287g1 [Macrostomum lignano]
MEANYKSNKFLLNTSLSTIGNVFQDTTQSLTSTALPGQIQGHKPSFGMLHFIIYIVLPILAFSAVVLLIFMAILCIRKFRLDKLRHRLMPLYQFDPADTDRDWEIDLLEDDRDQQVQQCRLAAPAV